MHWLTPTRRPPVSPHCPCRVDRRPNLSRPLSELIEDGEELVVTDPAYTQNTALWLAVQFEQ